MHFDHATAYLLTGILYTIVPGMIWRMLAGFQLRETAWWCGGGMVIGLGTILVSLRFNIGEMPLIGTAFAALFYSGIILKILALKSFLKLTIQIRFWIWLGVLYTFIELLISELFGLALRSLFIVVTHALMYGYLARLAWKIHVELNRQSILWIFWGYCAVVVMLLGVTLSSLGPNPELWSIGLPATLLAVFGILILFTNHIAYMALVLENLADNFKAFRLTAEPGNAATLFSRMFYVAERERALANVSRKLLHEVNQPLSSMRYTVDLFSRALRDNRLAELDFNELVDRLSNNLGLAIGVVNQIRPLANAKAPSLEPVEMRSIVADALSLMAESTTNIRLVIAKNVDRRLLINGIRIELIQVLVNILRNAFQACNTANQPADIFLELSANEEEACVVIADNGPGFSESALQHAGKSMYGTKTEGMGLGLWICEEIMSRHAGKLTVSNRCDGHSGAVVTLTLPLLRETNT